MKSCIPVCVIAIGVLKSRCFQTQVSTFCYSSFLRRLFMVNILRNDFSWVHQPWKQSITCNKFIFCFDNHCSYGDRCLQEELYELVTLVNPDRPLFISPTTFRKPLFTSHVTHVTRYGWLLSQKLGYHLSFHEECQLLSFAKQSSCLRSHGTDQ